MRGPWATPGVDDYPWKDDPIDFPQSEQDIRDLERHREDLLIEGRDAARDDREAEARDTHIYCPDEDGECHYGMSDCPKLELEEDDAVT